MVSKTSPLTAQSPSISAALGLGEGHGRYVVGHPRPQRDDRDVGRSERHLERGLDPGGHLERPLDEADPTGEVGRLGRDGGGQPNRAGVRGGRREGPEPHHHPDPQPLHQLYHGSQERLPSEVGLGTDEVQDVGAVAVGAGNDLDGRPGELGGDPVDQLGDWPPRPLVDERLGVEAGHGDGGRRTH